MKKQKKKNQYQEKLSWDDMTYGEHLIILVEKLLKELINQKKIIVEKQNTRTETFKMNKRELLLVGFVIDACWYDYYHPPNFTPILHCLFGGTTFKNKWLGISLPLIAMGLSDMYLGFYGISYWVYGSFLLISILGTYWKR